MSELSDFARPTPTGAASSADGDGDTAVLRAVYPPTLPWRLGLGRERVVIGRTAGAGARVVLGHRTVSRAHVALSWDDAVGAHVAVDLESRNGTRIDGADVASGDERRLGDSAIVQLGDVFLVYERPGPEDDPRAAELLPGDSPAVRALRAAISRAAAVSEPVLLIGEPGTGKEWAASALHELSGRLGPLIPVDCAEPGPQRLDSRLLGHVRGALDDSPAEHEGLIRAADGGVLFLDHIDELEDELVDELAQIIQLGSVKPLGSDVRIPVDVRVVGATTAPLERPLAWSAIAIEVPPLRARRGDIMMWLDTLRTARPGRRSRGGPPALSPDAIEALLLAEWPDNLRGLDRLVRTLPVSIGGLEGLIEEDDLPTWLTVTAISLDPGQRVPRARTPAPRAPVPTRDELQSVLMELDGDISAVAKHFGRDRRQIFRWLDTYGLERKRPSKKRAGDAHQTSDGEPTWRDE